MKFPKTKLTWVFSKRTGGSNMKDEFDGFIGYGEGIYRDEWYHDDERPDLISTGFGEG